MGANESSERMAPHPTFAGPTRPQAMTRPTAASNSHSGSAGGSGLTGLLPPNNHIWDRNFQSVTPRELKKLREAFWDRITQRNMEIWTGLRLAVEAEDAPTRVAILESIECTDFMPNPDDPTACYVWDSRGARYDIPYYTMYSPRSLVTEEEIEARDAKQRAEAIEQLRQQGKLGAEIRFTIRCPKLKDLLVEAPLTATVLNIRELVSGTLH